MIGITLPLFGNSGGLPSSNARSTLLKSSPNSYKITLYLFFNLVSTFESNISTPPKTCLNQFLAATVDFLN